MAYGIPFPPIRDRFLMREEALQIILSMWDKETKSTTFNGRF